MGFPTKVQLIKRKASEQWYINFPSALAQAMDFSRGETVEWTVEDKSLLALRRLRPPASTLKKTPPASSPPSSNSGANASPPSTSSAWPRAPKPSR
jgi:antitoxin component of MazEF toxin-antitoxin module